MTASSRRCRSSCPAETGLTCPTHVWERSNSRRLRRTKSSWSTTPRSTRTRWHRRRALCLCALVVADGRGPAAARNRGAECGAGAGGVLHRRRLSARPGNGSTRSRGWPPERTSWRARPGSSTAIPSWPRPADRHQPPDRVVVRRAGADCPVHRSPATSPCRADLFRSLPFDERFPLAAGEDREWCRRLVGSTSTHRVRARGVGRAPPRPVVGAVLASAGALRPRCLPVASRSASRVTGWQPLAFYTGLVRAGSPTVRVRARWSVLAQFATAFGLARGGPGRRRAAESASGGEQWLAGRSVGSPPASAARGGGDVLEPRWPRRRDASDEVPGTTRAHASPSVWLPERPLPTPWRRTVP